jgi:large subunit ribosomal protein L18
MSHTTRYKTKMRRRREGKTDYAKRLNLVKSGKSRLVIRISNNKIVTQVIKYDKKGDQTLVNTTSLELKKYGYAGHRGNVCAAYLTGLLCGKKAADQKIKEAVPDIGLHTPVKGSNVFAVIKGAADAGLSVPHDKEKLPSDDRVLGKTINEFRKVDLKIDDVKKKILSEKHGKV